MSWFRGFRDLYSVQTMKERGLAENCNSFVTPGKELIDTIVTLTKKIQNTLRNPL